MSGGAGEGFGRGQGLPKACEVLNWAKGFGRFELGSL